MVLDTQITSSNLNSTMSTMSRTITPITVLITVPPFPSANYSDLYSQEPMFLAPELNTLSP